MSGGGGKGGSESTQTQIPEWLSKASQDAVGRGNAVGDIGYTPYVGPEIAAFNASQEAAFGNNRAMATDLGLSAPRGTGMPAPTDYGNGIVGYGSYEPWKATMAKFAEERPGQSAMIDSFFIDPQTGEAGDLTMRRITEARQMMESGQPFAGGGYGPDGNEGPTGSGTASAGGGLFGGYSGLGDMTDGGGPGRSGSSYQGGGAISAIGNARNDISQAITGRDRLGGNDGGGGGGKGGR